MTHQADQSLGQGAAPLSVPPPQRARVAGVLEPLG